MLVCKADVVQKLLPCLVHVCVCFDVVLVSSCRLCWFSFPPCVSEFVNGRQVLFAALPRHDPEVTKW